MGHRALFLDRDGVINERRAFLVRRVDHFVFRPGVPEALARARRAGWKVVVATNQWPVAVGIIPRRALDGIHARMSEEAARAGAVFDLIQHCPHWPLARCLCKKPRPGMLLDAARRLDIDLARSWMVGDQHKDMQAGRAAGCRVALVNVAVRAQAVAARSLADVEFPGLPEFVDWLLAQP